MVAFVVHIYDGGEVVRVPAHEGLVRVRKGRCETGMDAFVRDSDRGEMVQESDAVPVGEVGWLLEGEGADDVAE